MYGHPMSRRKKTITSAFASTLIAVFAATAVLPPALADPPPWAPAYGYRYKKGGKFKKYKHALPPSAFGIDLGQCNRDQLGGALGAAAGAALGSQVGKGGGKTAAIVGGAILGALVGGSLGRAMDQVDQNCVGQALERAEDGQTIVWNNPQTGARYQLTPTKIYTDTQNRYCREYITKGTIGGKEQQLYGKACRQPDGSWELVK